MIKIISDISIVNEQTFQKIFELGWSNLDGRYHESGWKLLYKLIDIADSQLIKKIIHGHDASKFDDLQSRRFNHLNDVFEENEYYRKQAEEAAKRQYEERFENQS